MSRCIHPHRPIRRNARSAPGRKTTRRSAFDRLQPVMRRCRKVRLSERGLSHCSVIRSCQELAGDREFGRDGVHRPGSECGNANHLSEYQTDGNTQPGAARQCAGERTRADRDPAFANPKIGKTTRLATGCTARCNRTTGGSVEAKNSSIAPNITSSFSGLPACVSPRSRFCKASIAA